MATTSQDFMVVFSLCVLTEAVFLWESGALYHREQSCGDRKCKSPAGALSVIMSRTTPWFPDSHILSIRDIIPCDSYRFRVDTSSYLDIISKLALEMYSKD